METASSASTPPKPRTKPSMVNRLDAYQESDLPGTPPPPQELPNTEKRPASVTYDDEQVACGRRLQRAIRRFMFRTRYARSRSAEGRPAQVRVLRTLGLELLCDFRNLAYLYCNVRVLKQPFGPFMFQFQTSRCTNVYGGHWEDDELFVPYLSSKCEIVLTLVGVTSRGRKRHLGQSVIPLHTYWERSVQTVTESLGKWKFPTEEELLGTGRYIKGQFEVEIKPVASNSSGQFLMAPPMKLQNSTSWKALWSAWSKTKEEEDASTNTHATSSTLKEVEGNLVCRWGVLSDTYFHLFDHNSAKLYVSLDLAKLQLIQPTEQEQEDANTRLYPVKVYSQGSTYVLFVSTLHLQQLWVYRIDCCRRKLLIP